MVGDQLPLLEVGQKQWHPPPPPADAASLAIATAAGAAADATAAAATGYTRLTTTTSHPTCSKQCIVHHTLEVFGLGASASS